MLLASLRPKAGPSSMTPRRRIPKEDIALKIAQRDGIKEGLICILTCVEPCPVVRHPKGQKAEAVETGGPLAQMPSSLFLLVGSRVRPDASATADRGTLYDSGLHQWGGSGWAGKCNARASVTRSMTTASPGLTIWKEPSSYSIV